MRILYIGYLFNENEYVSNKALSFAAGRFEKGFVIGMKEQDNVEIEIISIEPQLRKFPHGKMFVKGRKLCVGEGLEAKSITYINIPFLKHICIYIKLFFYILFWRNKYKQEEKCLVSYNADVPLIQIGLWAEKKGIKYMPILADLPFYEEEGDWKSLGKKLSALGHRSQLKNLKRLKNAMVLNENSAHDFDIPSFVLVDGAVTENELAFSIDYTPGNSRKNILYCGSLDVFHGTDKLLNIGIQRRDYNIFICGRGKEWANRISEEINNHTNIHLYEDASNETIYELYKNMDLLIIPHPVNYKQLRYQFPSKLMTCMATGIPVLLTPIPGVGKDYYDKVNVSKDDSMEELISSIDDFFDKTAEHRREQGKLAREYVINFKSWKTQTNRIIDFLKG